MAYNRKAIVKRLRKEGEEAFLAGIKRCHCPYKYMDEYQWLTGFDWAEEAARDANVVNEDDNGQE